MDHRGARADDRPLPHRHAGTDEYIRRHPSIRSDDDGCDDQWHRGVPVVVAGSAQVGVLAHRCVSADRDWRNAVAIHMIGQAAVSFHGQVPRRPNLRPWIGMGTRSDARPKSAQHQAAPAV